MRTRFRLAAAGLGLLCAALATAPAGAEEQTDSIDVLAVEPSAKDSDNAPAGAAEAWGDSISVALDGQSPSADSQAVDGVVLAPGEHPVFKLRPALYSDADAQEISLDELLSLAMENNLGIQGEHLSIEKGHYSVDNTYYTFDPSIRASLNYSKSTRGGTGAATSGGVSSSQGYDASFDYTLPREFGDSFSFGYNLSRSEYSLSSGGSDAEIPTTYSSSFNIGYNRPLGRNAGKYVNRIPRYLASNNLVLSYDRLDDQLRQLRKRVLDAFFTAVSARETIKVRETSLERALRQLEREVERYKAGLSIQADVLQAENAVLTQRSALLSAQTQYHNLLDSLTSLVGLPQEYRLRLEGDSALLPLGSVLPEDLWDLVACNSFELKSLNTQLANLRLSREQLLNQLKPDLGLALSYGRNGEDEQLGKAITGVPNESYQIGISYNGRPGERAARTAVASNDLDLASVELQIQDAELALKTELRAKQRDLEEKAQQIALAESNLDVVQKTYDITVERNRVGLATTLDTIEAQENVLAAELALLNARVAYQQAYRELLLLAGLI